MNRVQERYGGGGGGYHRRNCFAVKVAGDVVAHESCLPKKKVFREECIICKKKSWHGAAMGGKTHGGKNRFKLVSGG